MHTCSKLLCALVAVLMLATASQVAAQTEAGTTSTSGKPFGVGDKVLAIGIGLGVSYDYIEGTARWPALIAIYDQGVTAEVGPGVIGLGGIVGYKLAHYDYGVGSLDARWTNLIVGARGSYHLPLGVGLEKLDVYGGTMLGLRFSRYHNEYLSLSGFRGNYNRVRLAAGLFAGARYDFTDALGAWTEIGYDVAIIKFGVHFNL